jgi:sugar phosphate isomerase/epimerase
MPRTVDRRTFLSTAAAAVAAPAFAADTKEAPFKISLAQWSLHRAFFAFLRKTAGDQKDPLRFAETAKQEYGISAVEYVNQFYKDKKKDDAYVKDLKKVADDAGVRSVLIMCDNEGALGDPDEVKQQQAVENHYRWVEWAKYLGCHSIRVNAYTGNKGTREEQAQRVADGLRKLNEFGAKHEIGVIVENHGGLSSDGLWLSGVMKAVGSKNCGTLPDFGNFGEYDRYKGVDELMPFAKGVSAKTHDFDEKGNESHTDYRKMLDIVVKKHNYHGHLGIEYEGNKLSEPDGIRASKKLLDAILAEMKG